MTMPGERLATFQSWKEAVRPYYLKWFHFPAFPRRKPSCFQECCDYPRLALEGAEIQQWIGKYTPDHADLLFLPVTDWHTRIQRTQHLARSFAALGHRCFVLNPHLGREFPNPPGFGEPVRLGHLGSRVAEIHVQLPREPAFHHRLLSPAEDAAVLEALQRILRLAGSRRTIQIVSSPLWLEVAAGLRTRSHSPVIYDCHDVLPGFRDISPDIVAREEPLFRAADLAVFSSRHLFESCSATHPWLQAKSMLVRNAVDERALRGGYDSEEGKPERPAVRTGKITAGYVGSLDYWFDVDTVEMAARACPEWRFILVGRVEDRRIERLRRLKNVDLPGEVPHSELHRYLSAFDVAMIPFLQNRLTLGMNPVKLYEYFCFGLPVISARLPEIEEYSELVYLADNAEAWVAQLAAAAAERGSERREERMRISRRESWTSRAVQLARAFETALVT